jgi:hypothetical protein
MAIDKQSKEKRVRDPLFLVGVLLYFDERLWFFNPSGYAFIVFYRPVPMALQAVFESSIHQNFHFIGDCDGGIDVQ